MSQLLNPPLVSIFLASFNRAHLIGETLDSILNQTYTNWECYIIDDNSTDTTERFLHENYINKDTRFKFFKKDISKYIKGLADSRNMSLDIARDNNVEYLQFFDDDDIMHPQKFELQMKPFVEDPNLDMSVCMYRKFGEIETIDFDLDRCDDKSCNITSTHLFWDFYKNKINLNSLGPIWKMSSIKSFNFDKTLNIGEEKDFYLRVFLKKNIKYKPVNSILFWYRKHTISVTKGTTIDSFLASKSMLRSQQKIRLLIVFAPNIQFVKRLKTLFYYFRNS